MTTTVRPRAATRVRVLADVHRTDGYPMRWPADPSSWLSPDGLQGAWIAESGGTVVGHAVVIGLGDDARPAAGDGVRRDRGHHGRASTPIAGHGVGPGRRR